jgi:tetratricopeptide (TPR) repeat protein
VIEGVDAFGRRTAIPREEYRTRMLPELLKAHGNNPDQLVGIILQALRDGLAADVLAAANRLTVVDKDVERALSVLAVVQRDAGELDSAEATLRELLQKRPQSAAARVGLGMLALQRGDQAAAADNLSQALALDVNHPDAVHGWLQLRHDTVGDAGYLAELQELAARPQAWRAKLWLARHLGQKGDADAAAAVYRDVLALAGDQQDAQIMASGDLVQMQRHDLVRELVAPRFVPGRSHPHVGLALLHHFAQTQDHVAGAALLHQMHLHYGHLVGGELQPFTAEFDRQRLAKLPPPAPISSSRCRWCAVRAGARAAG